MRECDRGREIIKQVLQELNYVCKKVSEIMDDLDNAIAKTLDNETRKDLNYVYSSLEMLHNELKDYCIGDCSLCNKNCEIMCDVDCHECVRFFKCLQEKKVSRMVFS